jgi:hypothetical protein
MPFSNIPINPSVLIGIGLYLTRLVGNWNALSDLIGYDVYLTRSTRFGGVKTSPHPLQESAMRLTTKGRFAVTAMIDWPCAKTQAP